MRKRDHRVEIYFNDDELARLTEQVRKSGLSRERYCRQVLNGSEVREAPTADAFALIREVRQVGSNLDQILAKANSIGLLDVLELRRTAERINAAMLTVMDAYDMGVG